MTGEVCGSLFCRRRHDRGSSSASMVGLEREVLGRHSGAADLAGCAGFDCTDEASPRDGLPDALRPDVAQVAGCGEFAGAPPACAFPLHRRGHLAFHRRGGFAGGCSPAARCAGWTLKALLATFGMRVAVRPRRRSARSDQRSSNASIRPLRRAANAPVARLPVSGRDRGRVEVAVDRAGLITRPWSLPVHGGSASAVVSRSISTTTTRSERHVGAARRWRRREQWSLKR